MLLCDLWVVIVDFCSLRGLLKDDPTPALRCECPRGVDHPVWFLCLPAEWFYQVTSGSIPSPTDWGSFNTTHFLSNNNLWFIIMHYEDPPRIVVWRTSTEGSPLISGRDRIWASQDTQLLSFEPKVLFSSSSTWQSGWGPLFPRFIEIQLIYTSLSLRYTMWWFVYWLQNITVF